MQNVFSFWKARSGQEEGAICKAGICVLLEWDKLLASHCDTDKGPLSHHQGHMWEREAGVKNPGVIWKNSSFSARGPVYMWDGLGVVFGNFDSFSGWGSKVALEPSD